MESIIEAIPLLIAALVPPLLAWVRRRVEIVPDRYIPILLPVAGALVAIGAEFAGFNLGSFDAATADLSAWQTVVTGILSGLAANGVHQIAKQRAKAQDDDEPGFV